MRLVCKLLIFIFRLKIGITCLYFQTFESVGLIQMMFTEFSLHAWKLWFDVFVFFPCFKIKIKPNFFFLSSHRFKSGRTWISSAVRRFTVKPQGFALVIEQPYAQLSAVPFCTSDQAAYLSTLKLSCWQEFTLAQIEQGHQIYSLFALFSILK